MRAATAALSIFALLAAKYLGATWMDPAMGVVGALLVARWSVGLIRTTARVLLDHQAPAEILETVRRVMTEDGETEVADVHIWAIGPGRYAAAIAMAGTTQRPAEEYKARLGASQPDIVHVTIELEATYSPTTSVEHATR